MLDLLRNLVSEALDTQLVIGKEGKPIKILFPLKGSAFDPNIMQAIGGVTDERNGIHVHGGNKVAHASSFGAMGSAKTVLMCSVVLG